MRIIIAIILVFLSTAFVLIKNPQMPKSITIENSDAVFSEKEVIKEKAPDYDIKNIEAERREQEYKLNKLYNTLYTKEQQRKETKKEEVIPPQKIEIIEVYDQPKISKPIDSPQNSLSEEEELLHWNKWHANLATESLRRLNEINLDKYVEYRTIVVYSIVVTNKRKIASVSIDAVLPLEYYDVVSQKAVPVLKTLDNDPILEFPKGTKRTQNKFTGTIISTPEGRKVADPSEYQDFETIKNLIQF